MVQKVWTLNDRKRRNGHFCVIWPNWWLLGPITSKRLTLDHACMLQNYSPKNLFLYNVWFVAIYSQRLLGLSVLKRGTPLESENLTCATMRGHISNRCAFVFGLWSEFVSTLTHVGLLHVSAWSRYDMRRFG